MPEPYIQRFEEYSEVYDAQVSESRELANEEQTQMQERLIAAKGAQTAGAGSTPSSKANKTILTRRQRYGSKTMSKTGQSNVNRSNSNK